MSKEEIYKVGDLHIKVTKNDAGTEVLKVEHGNGNRPVKTGKITDLKLVEPAGKMRSIVNITNDTTIETHSSPGCAWYFFNGRWWYICS